MLVKISCLNINGGEFEVNAGITVAQILQTLREKSQHLECLEGIFVASIVNNRIRDLNYEIYTRSEIAFLTIDSSIGRSVYERTLLFILTSAVHKLFGSREFEVIMPVFKGQYCSFKEGDISLEDIANIKKEMLRIVNSDTLFEKEKLPIEAIKQIYQSYNAQDKIEILESQSRLFPTIHKLDDYYNYFYGLLMPSAKSVKEVGDFDIVPYNKGFILFGGGKFVANIEKSIKLESKFFNLFKTNKRWLEISSYSKVADINKAIETKQTSELVQLSEIFQDGNIREIAQEVRLRFEDKVRVVLISGPSSSGKTTFTKRLALHLKVLGLEALQISLDDFFVDRDKTPKDDKGNLNFEDLNAINIKLLNSVITDIINGKSVSMPRYDFISGKSIENSIEVTPKKERIILIEGIHALNPNLLQGLEKSRLFKVYISALSSLALDRHNYISTTDIRLMRRLVRDFKYRNYSAEETLSRWASVREGEEKNIFPYQEEADVMFNSFLPFEICLLKDRVERLLLTVSQNKREHCNAMRLLHFLSFFKSMEDAPLPQSSILREFVGGSCFKY